MIKRFSCLAERNQGFTRTLAARALRRADTSEQGFTLVELMTVVVIVGVLATLGIAALREHVFGSKSTEALAMMQSIRVAEERWKAENMTYLNVSTANAWYPADPRTDSKRIQRNFFTTAGGHVDDASWKALNPVAPGPVEFGYLVNAGFPSQPMTTPAITPTGWTGWIQPTENWYVIQAVADVDHDGIPAYFLASSVKGDIYRQNEGE
ncbi:MAG TPA: prepilin-type N-terminal cleavage/methylation domain-containing protein [Polyangiaceae bacterium]|jgi:prepilin-type N-terminal cleavage/methylation domain-containing protein|nr:prepilin-type N-terminal cleavage/methylation domain-containing protein [Polyangiaceae bacterium]